MNDSITNYLRADEKVLWKGRPQQGIRFTGRDIVLVPFTLVWSGGALTAFWNMPMDEVGLPFVLFPLIFLIAGTYVTVGRFIHDAWARSNIEYALTDRRVLILKGWPGGDLTALDIVRIDRVGLKTESGERGDVTFGDEPSLFAFNRSFRGVFGLWVPSLEGVARFQGIENARRIFDQVETIRARAG
jgi:hypothetical protein